MRALVSVISVTDTLETDGSTGPISSMGGDAEASVVGASVVAVSAGNVWASANTGWKSSAIDMVASTLPFVRVRMFIAAVSVTGFMSATLPVCSCESS